MFDPLKSLEKHLGEFDFNSRVPFYNDDSDYTTNAPSYYDDLARKNKLIKHLALRIWKYDDELKKRFEAWDKNLEEFDDEVLKLLQEWMDDGTFDEIINDTIFNDLNDKLDRVIFKTAVGINDYLTGEGVETEKFQQALNENAGKIIIIPPEMTVTIDAPVNVPDDTTIYGYNSVIQSSHSEVMIELNDNTCIKGVKFIHDGNFNTDVKAINIEGIVGIYKKNICIEDCIFESIGGYGINMLFTEYVDIINCKFLDIGYAGIHGSSVSEVNVKGGSIKNVYGHSSVNNCYGVAFTRSGLDNDLSVYPRSKNCTVANMIIEDIPTWEGLDTHAGENINFINNTIKNCQTGIALVSSHLQGTPDHPPKNCKVRGNTIYGRGTGAGISMSGTLSESHEGSIVSNNTLIECGERGNNIRGAIRSAYTRGAIYSGNTIIKPLEAGINLYVHNKNAIVTGNTIIDPHSKTWGATCHVTSREYENSAIISNNQFIRRQTDLNDYVAMRSVHVTRHETNQINIDNNMDESERGPSGDYYSLKNIVDKLEPSEIVKDDVDFGYTVQFAQGLTMTWKTVVLNATSTEIQEVPFPDEVITSGHIGGSAALEISSLAAHNDFNLMSLSTNVDGWRVRFSEGGQSEELSVRLFAIGMTLE